MSLANYSDLQTAVGNWLKRADQTALIPDFITLAETQIFRDLRVRQMETVFSGTIAADGTLALPGSNYIDLKHAYIVAASTTPLLRQSPKFIYDKYPNRTSVALPRYLAREGGSFIFGPFPDSTYTVGGVYYQNLGPLSTNQTHAAFTNNPDVYLFGTLLQAVRTLKDDAGVARWEPLYTAALLSANAADQRESWSGSDLAAVAA
jgi:hypothetical protein